MNKHITVSLTEAADRLAGNSLRPMHTVRIIAIPTARCLCLPKTSASYTEESNGRHR
jgi:hypothetical protein